MKKWEISLLCGLLIAVLFSFAGLEIKAFDRRCDSIRNKVLRLHILANSDSKEDQALKLCVRDRLIKEGEKLFVNAENESEAEEIAKQNVGLLTAAAKDEIKKQGYDYDVKIEVGDHVFNTREYEDITMPPGHYKAVRVLIGEAGGKNWWCVMFPPLCLPAAEQSEKMTSNSEKLGEVLDQKEVDIVTDKPKYEFRFKTVELFNKAGEWFKNIF